jgi:hypothetical protein
LATCKDAGQAVLFSELSDVLGGQETPVAAPTGRDSRMLEAENGSLAIRAAHSEKASSRVLQGTMARIFFADD